MSSMIARTSSIGDRAWRGIAAPPARWQEWRRGADSARGRAITQPTERARPRTAQTAAQRGPSSPPPRRMMVAVGPGAVVTVEGIGELPRRIRAAPRRSTTAGVPHPARARRAPHHCDAAARAGPTRCRSDEMLAGPAPARAGDLETVEPDDLTALHELGERGEVGGRIRRRAAPRRRCRKRERRRRRVSVRRRQQVRAIDVETVREPLQPAHDERGPFGAIDHSEVRRQLGYEGFEFEALLEEALRLAPAAALQHETGNQDGLSRRRSLPEVSFDNRR